MPDKTKDKTKEKTKDRFIRVFISSTFRDMQAERDEMGKFIFPQLRRLCERRGVTWGEVDLRWGITEEQSQRGEVLPICLAEIKKCRPYFIGLLGERYGWVPDEIPQELIEQEEWLKEHLNHSVTELEILHGVLKNPEMAEHAFFYFRDPAYLDTLSDEKKTDYCEIPPADEIKKYGLEEATRRAEERIEKLAALKQRIRKSGFPVQENYPDPKALGELVLKDLTALINRLYPEDEAVNPLDRDAEDHEAFARSRAGVYIGRKEYFDCINEHLNSDKEPLIILGESGSGKSALLANWAIKYRESHPDVLLIQHFIGATPYSAEWMAMLRRIMGELKRRFDINQEIPDKPDALRMAFANFLHMASASCSTPSPHPHPVPPPSRGRELKGGGEGKGEGLNRPSKIIIVLDALNQIEDKDAAPDLVWLPPVMPENVRLILSTLPGRPLEELKKRGWKTLKVEPLTLSEREKLITEYLEQYTKTLSSDLAKKVSSAKQASNPLYLRALLEELRLYGDHFTLNKQIDHYLSAETVDSLYEKILERYEGDYERDRPKLVRDAMRLLWAARRGLSEAELLELLGKEGMPLPHAHWSPLYLAAEQSLISRSGFLGFAHDYLRQAVLNKYLDGNDTERQAHLRIAGYFEPKELDERKVEELLWQFLKAKEWRKLFIQLSDLKLLCSAWSVNRFDVCGYWGTLQDETSYSMVEAYRDIISGDYLKSSADGTLTYLGAGGGQKKVYIVEVIGILLEYAGFLTECEALSRVYVDFYRSDQKNARILRACLSRRSLMLANLGKLEEALELCWELEDYYSKNGPQSESAIWNRNNMAMIYCYRRNLVAAKQIYESDEKLIRNLGDKRMLQFNLINQAHVLLNRYEYDEALKKLDEAERSNQEECEMFLRCGIWHNQGVILRLKGELDAAMSKHKKQEQLCKAVGFKLNLGQCYGQQGLILKAQGKLDDALKAYKAFEQICREVGHLYSLQEALSYQARIHHIRSDLDGAMALRKEEERICRELGNKDGLQNSLGNQGIILADRGELDGAMALYKEQERICRELGNPQELAYSLVNKASLLSDKIGRPHEALPLAEEAYRLATDHGLNALAGQIKPILDAIRAKIK